jgi:hypothetical protein
MYRLGWYFATLLAKIGVPLLIKVDIMHDDEANVYVATSSDVQGLVIEAETLDELEREVLWAVPELLELNYASIKATATTRFSFSQQPILL